MAILTKPKRWIEIYTGKHTVSVMSVLCLALIPPPRYYPVDHMDHFWINLPNAIGTFLDYSTKCNVEIPFKLCTTFFTLPLESGNQTASPNSGLLNSGGRSRILGICKSTWLRNRWTSFEDRLQLRSNILCFFYTNILAGGLETEV